jgi:hypothetical protein
VPTLLNINFVAYIVHSGQFSEKSCAKEYFQYLKLKDPTL